MYNYTSNIVKLGLRKLTDKGIGSAKGSLVESKSSYAVVQLRETRFELSTINHISS